MYAHDQKEQVYGRKPLSAGGNQQQQGLAQTRPIQDGGNIDQRTIPNKAHYTISIGKTDTTSRRGNEGI